MGFWVRASVNRLTHKCGWWGGWWESRRIKNTRRLGGCLSDPYGVTTCGGKGGPDSGLADGALAGAVQGAVMDAGAVGDDALAEVAAAWPGLPAAVRRRVLELVRAGGDPAGDDGPGPVG